MTRRPPRHSRCSRHPEHPIGALWSAALAALLLVACQGEIGNANGSPEPENLGPGAIEDPAEDVLPSNVRRLSRGELDRVMGSLLHTTFPYASTMLPEDDQEREGLFLHWAFDNRYTHQPTERVLVQAYEGLAREAASQLVADAERLAMVLPCSPSGASDTACFEEFVRTFGRRAFRRPLTDEEVARMMPLMAEADTDDDFNVAIDLALRAFLQAPDFLYRIEIGVPLADHEGVRQLDAYAIATRMALFLWGTGPTDELLDLAETGVLDTVEGRRETAFDMLQDPQALDQVDRFHALWLGYRQLPHSPELTTSMRLETRGLIERVVFAEDAPYMDIFRATDTFIDARLAEHYGMTLSGDEPAFVEYEDAGRAGILAHGAVLGAFSTGGDTSTTRRGIHVRERLLCQVIPPPPPTVNVDDIPETNCKSEFLEVHQMGACGGCHTLMDPVGWGLENYDLEGRYREHDEGKPECQIDGEGEIDNRAFNGPRELGELLIDGGRLERCVVRQVMRFAMGREELPSDEPYLAYLSEDRVGTDWTFQELLIDIVANERFALVREDINDGGE